MPLSRRVESRFFDQQIIGGGNHLATVRSNSLQGSEPSKAALRELVDAVVKRAVLARREYARHGAWSVCTIIEKWARPGATCRRTLP